MSVSPFPGDDVNKIKWLLGKEKVSRKTMLKNGTEVTLWFHVTLFFTDFDVGVSKSGRWFVTWFRTTVRKDLGFSVPMYFYCKKFSFQGRITDLLFSTDKRNTRRGLGLEVRLLVLPPTSPPSCRHWTSMGGAPWLDGRTQGFQERSPL